MEAETLREFVKQKLEKLRTSGGGGKTVSMGGAQWKVTTVKEDYCILQNEQTERIIPFAAIREIRIVKGEVTLF